jgi:hypothetical protein
MHFHTWRVLQVCFFGLQIGVSRQIFVIARATDLNSKWHNIVIILEY